MSQWNRAGVAQLIVLAFLSACCAPAAAQSGSANEFRIESQVYVAESATPVSQNVTLFARGMVYDFQMASTKDAQPIEIVMYEERKRELILLDVARQLQWKVADLRLLTMVDQLRRETISNPKMNFLVGESFTEEQDWASDQVSLSSKSIRYLLKGKRPANDSVLPRYYDFLDQITRLSASDPKRIPPFARLALNQTIKSQGWIPSEVKVEIAANEFFKQPFSASSKHAFVMSLSDEDQRRIQFARRCWAEFEECSLLEYRQIPAPQKRFAAGRKADTAPAGAKIR